MLKFYIWPFDNMQYNQAKRKYPWTNEVNDPGQSWFPWVRDSVYLYDVASAYIKCLGLDPQSQIFFLCRFLPFKTFYCRAHFQLQLKP